MKGYKKTKINFLEEKLDSLPWYCILILALSIFIAFLATGFAIGIITQKEKIKSTQEQLTKQQVEEEKKIETIIRSYQEKTIGSSKNASYSSSLEK